MEDRAQEYLMQERERKPGPEVYVLERDVQDQYSTTKGASASPQPSNHPYLTGWRKGVAMGVCMVAFTLVVNIVAIGVFVSHYGIENGLISLYEGECNRVSNINLAVHLVINVLGTLLLAASNYCMQVLSAPTRQEVDRTHTRQKWLDIGLSSFRNLFWIQRWKVCVWILLLVSSLPLHLVYNSVVFSSIGAYEYTGVLVNPAFIDGPTYDGTINVWTDNEVIGNSPTLADVQRIQADAASFERLENSECISMYHKALVTDRSDLILVSSFHNTSDEESKVYLTFQDGDFYVDFDGIAGWICETYNETEFEKCLDKTGTPNPGTWSLKDHPIDYCLSRRNPEVCKVKSSLYLMIVVIICNIGKLAAMLVVLFKLRDNPLVTVWDAVSSFMNRPDVTTINACLTSKDDVTSGKFWREATHIKPWKRRRLIQSQAVSGRRWWLSILVCLIGIVVIILFLKFAIVGLEQSGVVNGSKTPSLRQIWSFGFGMGGGTSFWQNAPRSLYGDILFANLPQLIFSILYFVYNGLYTAMSLAAEWSSFSRARKGIRVSKPTGAQRSTYYLQLPYTYAVPLILASTLMHWFISQSFFLLSVDFSDNNGSAKSFTTCGYSTIAIIFGLGLAGLMVIAIFVNGFRRLTFDIPPVGSCSTAISAACHPPAGGQDVTLPLQWGAVVDQDHDHDQGNPDVGHCTFSCGEVLPPVEGEMYGSLTGGLKVRHGRSGNF